MNFTRRQIYDLVWSKPLNKVAAELGLSDQGLAKACRRCDVPVPPLGYWQKLAHGKHVNRPALDSDQFDLEYMVEVSVGMRLRPVAPQASKPHTQISGESSGAELTKATTPHPILKQVRKAFHRVKKPDEFAYVNVSPFKIRASPAECERVLALIAKIFAAALAERWEIKGSAHDGWELQASGENIEIAITENTKRTPHTPTPAEIREQQRYSWTKIPEFDYSPSGELKLTISSGSYLGLRTNWSDGKKQRLEAVLPGFIEGISIVGAALYTRRLEREEQERQWELQRQREAERRRLEEIQRTRLAVFKEQAKKHNEAEVLRAYVEGVKRSLDEIPEGDVPKVQVWIEWAEKSIQDLDPLCHGLPVLMTEDEASRNSWRYRDP